MQCHAGAGEIYNAKSSGEVSDLAACQKSCEDQAGCQSITFFEKSGWCSHFSSDCAETKGATKAISMRLGEAQLTTAASTGAGEWILCVTAFGDNILIHKIIPDTYCYCLLCPLTPQACSPKHTRNNSLCSYNHRRHYNYRRHCSDNFHDDHGWLVCLCGCMHTPSDHAPAPGSEPGCA